MKSEPKYDTKTFCDILQPWLTDLASKIEHAPMNCPTCKGVQTWYELNEKLCTQCHTEKSIKQNIR